VSDEISEVDMSDSDADATNYQQEHPLDTIALLEQRLRGAQTLVYF
jgi:hypothetical protein